jgi:hypothetical protein
VNNYGVWEDEFAGMIRHHHDGSVWVNGCFSQG